MMMYQHADAPYYDEEMDIDDGCYNEEDPYLHATRPYRWVRPGYVPPGGKKSELEERKEEIEKLKKEIAEKEQRLRLANLQREIKEIQKTLNEKEELARQRQATAEQAQINEKISKKHEQERKTKIQSSFKQVFNVPEKESPGTNGIASKEDVQRILNSRSDYDCFQLSQPTMLSTIKKKYKELARMLHPDKCKLDGAKEAFIKIGEAYDRLIQLYPSSDQ